MKMNSLLQKTILSVSVVGMLALLTSCADLSTLSDQIFNSNFLADVGAKEGTAVTQVTPNLPQFLVLKVQNQTVYPANITIYIKRAQETESFQVTVAGSQTVGKLIENCNSTTDPVLSLYVPTLSDNSSAVPVGQVFVLVDGLPVLVAASQLPGVLNVQTDFNCGDTVQFVISTSFSDVNRYQVSAVVFEGTTTD